MDNAAINPKANLSEEPLGETVPEATAEPALHVEERRAPRFTLLIRAAKLVTAQGEFFAPMDIAPELLLTTDHTVIATGHHRGNAGMRVLMETALGSPDAAKAALAKRGTAYVALCPALGEARMYAKIAPEGFVADLIDGDVPGWLEPVTLDQGNGLKVWRIRPE